MSNDRDSRELEQTIRGRRLAEAGEPRDSCETPTEEQAYDARSRELNNPNGIYKRPYSLRIARELRKEINEGLYQCELLIEADRLLDEIDAAKDTDELRACLKKLTQSVTRRT